MIRKVIKYKDYDGNLIESEFFFALSKAECTDLDFFYEEYGGLKEYLKSLVRGKDPNDIPKKPMWDFLKVVIEKAVAKRPYGKKFLVKNEEVHDEFFYTDAFSEFIEELFDTPDSIPAFMEGVLPDIPKEDMDKAKAELEKEGIKLPN